MLHRFVSKYNWNCLNLDALIQTISNGKIMQGEYGRRTHKKLGALAGAVLEKIVDIKIE